MSWPKLLAHDLRCGLVRIRYLFVPILFLLPCILCSAQLTGLGAPGTVGDYLLYCFKGAQIKQASLVSDFQLPVLWILPIVGCLYINLDFILNDLTLLGQQVIIRSGTRIVWYLSKCVWNMMSSLLYLILGILTIFVFSLLSGGTLNFENTPVVTMLLLDGVIFEPVQLDPWQVLLLTVVSPLFTILALSILEMTLTLFMKPVISFLGCVCILIASIYLPYPYMLGNGAMAIRSSIVAQGGMHFLHAFLFALFVILVCTIVGAIRFQHTDILGSAE